MEKYVNGIAVKEYGDKNQPPIIFIHGFPFSSGMWEQQIKQFKEQYYCITYDIRGLGKSPIGDGQYTMEMFVDDLLAIMDGLELNQAIIAGFSMGGYITLRAIEREPERFSALILCDTKSEADDNAGKIKRAQGVKAVNSYGAEKFATAFVPLAFAQGARQHIPDIFNATLEQAAATSPEGIKGCLLAMAGRTDTTKFLSDISVPTLLVVGEQDAITPPDVMQMMHERINGSELVTIEEAGHMAPVEQPEIVNQAIGDFLSKLS